MERNLGMKHICAALVLVMSFTFFSSVNVQAASNHLEDNTTLAVDSLGEEGIMPFTTVRILNGSRVYHSREDANSGINIAGTVHGSMITATILNTWNSAVQVRISGSVTWNGATMWVHNSVLF